MTTESDSPEEKLRRAEDINRAAAKRAHMLMDEVQGRADVVYGFIETVEQTARLFGLSNAELKVALSVRLGQALYADPDIRAETNALYALILGTAQRAKENPAPVPNHYGSDSVQ